jgi:hypothetical protein|tara:strand:+ start:168 stop:416 length:249 start_codon:yes stop_codon:yes gene_type:complete
MIKIWFLLIIISVPNAPTVKYNGLIYPDEGECMTAKYELMETYRSKPTEYKSVTLIDSYCVEFESFPIKSLMNKIKKPDLGV